MIWLADFLRRHAKLLFGILAVAGLITFWSFLRIPSEAENQILFGLSLKRLAMGSMVAAVLLFNLGIVFWMSSKPSACKHGYESRFFAWLENHIALAGVALYIVCLAIGVLLLLVFHPFKNTAGIMESFRTLLGGSILWIFVLSLYLLALFRISYHDQLRTNKIVAAVDRFLLLAGIFLAAYLSYLHLLIWIGAERQTSYTYWNLLADEFLKGRLYLSNIPTSHDLTLYKGNWYVPMPPLPAIMMMPQAYLFGGENINTSYFSIFFSALNAVLAFLILDELARRKWITLSRMGMLLLVALLAFGTPHLWVGIRGRAWFVSQIVTVFFLALAVLCTLKSWSPWLVGLCIGLAVMSRPNGAMTWPFVLAIAMQILNEKRADVRFKDLLAWSIKSAVPVVLAVAGLLLYNVARFENPFDFGYVTISGDPNIVSNAQQFGIFSLHYIPTNLNAMLFKVPELRMGETWPILPSTVGTSIFLVTPPLLYLFHRYERKWWILGAWLSIVLNFIFLILYHNTGAHQFGYRYILDAIIPILAMLAVAMGSRVRWHFVLLLLVSAAFNIYGAYWFING